MSKVITLRLSQDEYEKISAAADIERRPVSNFITTRVLTDIEDSYYADSIEMAQIKSDKQLLNRIRTGHNDAKNR
ncbi:MAG: hypothetical protein COS41_04175, partial [Elusimicrobia bacterium CG03_land_8_20_14_0_80_50_18]